MRVICTTVAVVLMSFVASDLEAARVKDLASIRGVRSNQLIGYGLVVGLQGSGDDQQVYFTLRSVQLMLRRLGVQAAKEKVFDLRNLSMRNSAAVMVTASLPPFARAGSSMDITVSSLGNAKSLQGGTLLMTPLRGVDLKVYALAQGPLMVGGYTLKGGSGESKTKNHPTVARIPGGAIIEREVDSSFVNKKQQIVVALQQPDFTTASRMSAAINKSIGEGMAQATDPGTIVVSVPAEYAKDTVALLARLEAINVTADGPARVIVNERTGTVIVGQRVRLNPVAISHGALTLEVSERFNVSQPGPFSRKGRTRVTPESKVEAKEESSGLQLLKGGANLSDVVKALNALGASPRDLISIFQSLVAAGALPAKVVVQ